MSDRYEREFVELYTFFRTWFRGEVEKSEAAISRLADVCAQAFTLVTDTGDVLSRDEVLKWFFDRHGSAPAYDFRVEEAAVRQQHGDVTICTFTLRVGREGPGDPVLQTAVFREEPSAPNGVVFLHAHNTPIA